MNNLQDNALLILRYMVEEGLVAPKGISPRQLQTALGMDKTEFNAAERYLSQGKFTSGGGGDDGVRWLTPHGVQHVSEEMKKREPISLDSERILRFLIQEIGDNDSLSSDEILKHIKFSIERYHVACQQLVDFDFVKLVSYIHDEFAALTPTKLGRQAVHRNFRQEQKAPSIQAGAIFNAPVTGGNIQAIASAIDSEIQQNISSLSPAELHKEIEQTLEKLLEQITEHLDLQQKALYTQLAADLQKEISNPQPDLSKLHKLLAGLGLLSDLGGAIDFSQKTFELIVKAGPYVMLLGQLIIQLLQNAAH